MKFRISVSDFQYAMRTVKDVVPSSGPLAETIGVLIEAKDNFATFTAFNPEVIAKATVKVETEVQGVVVVDAAALYSAISHFKPRSDKGVGTSDITVASGARSKKLQITAKTRYASGNETTHKRVFALRNQEFFPAVPSPDNVEQTFEMPANIFMDGIDGVSYALSSDKHQLLFTGALFELSPNKLTLFATNGICLAEYTAPIKYEGKPVRLVLPGAFAAKVSKSFFDTDTLTISITPSMVFVRTPNLVLGGALIREDYPEYAEFFPTPEVEIPVDKYMLLDNLVNLSYETAALDDGRVTIVFSGGEAVLKCGPSNNGGIPTEFEGDFTVSCNLGLLAGSIRNIFGNDLRIGVTSPTSPIKFLSGEESHNGAELTCVLVPLSV